MMRIAGEELVEQTLRITLQWNLKRKGKSIVRESLDHFSSVLVKKIIWHS